jgi:hypothetical protein
MRSEALVLSFALKHSDYHCRDNDGYPQNVGSYTDAAGT